MSAGSGVRLLRNVVLSAFLALLAAPGRAQVLFEGISGRDAVRLEAAYRLVEEAGEEIWPGFSEVPMPIVLVTEESEYLIAWDGPSPEGFVDLGVDQRFGRIVSARSRTFDPGWSASFPAFGLPAVIVIGTAEGTGRSSTEWVLTVLHEHFHQLQSGAPGYYAETEALGLSASDPSGMWMLNYPFPYSDPEIGREVALLAYALRDALTANAPADAAWSLLRKLLDHLEPTDAKYLSFQLWQEGVARHVESRAAAIAASSFDAGAAFGELPDATSWTEAAREQRQRILGELTNVSLADNGRVAFYALGAALGALLDRDDPDWKARYLEEKFVLDRYSIAVPSPEIR